jgi:uncharacterized membrane protein
MAKVIHQARYGDLLLFLVSGVILGYLIGMGRQFPINTGSLISWLVLGGRLLLGLPFVLYIPGYLLQGLFFSLRSDLDSIERIGLSLGLSVALVTLLALLLNALPWGLSSAAILIGQGGLIILMMLVTVLVRWSQPSLQVYIPDVHPHLGRWWSGLGITEQRMMVVMAGALFLSLLTAAWIFLVPSSNQHMTEFYILGQEGLAEDYPRAITAGQTISITTGITNREGKISTYNIQVKLADQVIGQAGPITLEDEAIWEQPIKFSIPTVGDNQQVVFILEREGKPSPYRTLWLWINVGSAKAP